MDKAQKAKNLIELQKALSPERREFLSRFLERKWFKNTDFVLQKELLTLPFDWDGFLQEIVKRGDEVGGLEVIKLTVFKREEFFAFTRFQVRVITTNEVIEYREFINFKYGGNPGYTGIILLEVDGKIEYFCLKKTDKFPVAESVYDTFGEMVQYKFGELMNLPKSAEKIIKKQLAMDDIRIKRFIDLGELYMDSGKSNLKYSLFAAVIDISKNHEKIKLLNNVEINKTKRVKFEMLIEPIDRLGEYIHKVDNGYFLAIVARLNALGIINLRPL